MGRTCVSNKSDTKPSKVSRSKRGYLQTDYKRKKKISKEEVKKLLAGKSKNYKHKTSINEWHFIKINFKNDTVNVTIDNLTIGEHTSLGYSNLKQNIAFAVNGEVLIDDLKIYKSK